MNAPEHEVRTPGRTEPKVPKSNSQLGHELILTSDLVYFLQLDDDSMWRWSLRSKDGSVIAVGGRSYVTRRDCLESLMVSKASQHAAVVEE
jgi:uncharacterized protein YegP (UPF0339 family)